MTKLIYEFIRWWIGSGIFDRIKELVTKMMDEELTNEEKRQYVLTTFKSEYANIKTRVIDLIINIVLIQLKGSGL